MSYDLHFYKHKENDIPRDKISQYLSENLVAPNQENTQWFFENKDTEVYYSFDYDEQGAFEPEEEAVFLENFSDTGFSFNLNYMRPSFFGLEAFRFVERFCKDLDLSVLNPQSTSEEPYMPAQQEQFEIWNQTNRWASIEHFVEAKSCFLTESNTNKVWEYNYARQNLQQQLGDHYFVPKVFFFRTKQTNEAVTLTTWTEHVPIVLPTTDYILLTRQYKKFFRTVEDTALISRNSLLNHFGNEFESFDFPNCKIIHQNKAYKLKHKFNSIKADEELKTFAERLEMISLYNAKPE